MKTYTVKTDGYGTKYWYQNGQLHREDGPAIEYADGNRYWFQNGQLHREDGPAVEWANGSNQYWIHGIQFSEEQFNNRNKEACYDTIEINCKKYKLVPME